MTKKLNERRNKVIDRLATNRKMADKYWEEYSKANKNNDKPTKSWARQNQYRYEKKIFTAEAMIDNLNDKLGFQMGDYQKH